MNLWTGLSRYSPIAALSALGLALLASPSKASPGGDGGGACQFQLPTSSVCFTVAGPFPPPPAAPSYVEVVFGSIGAGFDVKDGVGYPGWCGDDAIGAAPDHQYCDLPTILRSSTGPLPAYLQTKPLDKLNYILNHKGTATPSDIQDAIWVFTNGIPSTGPGCQALVDDANAHGVGYVPGPGNIVAILLDHGEHPTVQPFIIELSCAACPACVNPSLGLGSAGNCTVLQLGSGGVYLLGPGGGVVGNACIGPAGKLSVVGSQDVTGSLRLAPGASYQHFGSGTTGPISTNVNLSPEIGKALAAASAYTAFGCSVSIPKLNTTRTIAGNGGLNVLCVGDVELAGKIVTLSGGPNDLFVIKVTGKFLLTGGGQIRVSGLPPSNVIYDVVGTGLPVALTGGWIGTCWRAAIVDGTVLAPSRQIALILGVVNGEVISSKDIFITLGSSVRCPACQ